MASIKPRGGRFELTVKRKAVREKPWYWTFDTEEAAIAYGKHVESLLDAGIVPPELLDDVKKYSSIGDLIREYMRERHVTSCDTDYLSGLLNKVGGVSIRLVNYKWIESWISSMKRVANLSPSTIRHNVGALARCFDWAITQGVAELAPNPLRLLPKGYSAYTPADAAVIAKDDTLEVKHSAGRIRRLESGEEERIRAVMNKVKPEGRERAFKLDYQAAIECVFDLAVESAMRLSEIYSIEMDMVDIENATIFLKKTKNGKSRQVPLSSVAIASLITYTEHVLAKRRGMELFTFDGGYLFPWLAEKKIAMLLPKERYEKVTSALSHQFTRIFEAAGCVDLNFHDMRHEATSRLFERTEMSDFEIMKITGHSSTQMLGRYANLRASDLARKMW
jgi:integrase